MATLPHETSGAVLASACARSAGAGAGEVAGQRIEQLQRCSERGR